MSELPVGAGAARFVGQRVPRKEDRRLLTGAGSYVDDITLPGMLHVVFVRSQVARGAIKGIDLEAARAVPGVRAIYTADDIAKYNPALFGFYGAPRDPSPKIMPLAVDRVTYVGDPVAIVIADDRYIAEDAASLVFVDVDGEDPVVTIAQAREMGPMHPEMPSNVGSEVGGPLDDETKKIFETAAHVVTGRITHQRQAHVPMETRGVVASLRGAGELTIHMSCQSPHMSARYFAMVFGLPETHIRVVSKDVGGAFGLKVHPWREEVAVVAASLLIRRPLKWIEDRLENLTSACQAREQDATIRMAFDADARMLAADIDYECNVGAFPHGADANSLGMAMFPGPYRLPKLSFRAKSYYSNTVGQAAYRGPWAIESLARETMLDIAARQIGIDPLEIRDRNLITRAEQPHSMVTGFVVTDVTPRETLEMAKEKINVAAFRAEQAAARKDGRYLGLGFAVYVEPTTMAMGGVLSTETAQVRVETTGKVTAVLSTHSQGHGTETTMAQVIADSLGVDVEDVSVMEDDSTRGGFGAGAGGSRQAVAGGGAARRASAILLGKIKAISARMLNANPDDIRIDRGKITVDGVPETTTTLKQVAEIAYLDPDRLAPDMEPGLEAQYRYRPPPIVFSNAAHACIVEVSAETGVIKILRWVACEDCGVMINPAIVEGQIAGGVVQGIGGILYEQISYDEWGNPTAATFKDYLIPSAHDVPEIEYGHLMTPSTNEGGFKGVGEGGAIIGPPTLVNAVADALSPFGVLPMSFPLTPARVLGMIDGKTPKL